MEDFWEIAVPLIALFGSIALAAVLLARVRAHAKPEQPEASIQVPASASRRQRRVLEKLEPEPEIPTLMDLVREEIEVLGIEDVAGSEDLSLPVMLRVFKRDAREGCSHEEAEFVVAEGVDRSEALEDDVTMVCPGCSGTNDEDSALPE